MNEFINYLFQIIIIKHMILQNKIKYHILYSTCRNLFWFYNKTNYEYILTMERVKLRHISYNKTKLACYILTSFNSESLILLFLVSSIQYCKCLSTLLLTIMYFLISSKIFLNDINYIKHTCFDMYYI